MTAPVLTVLEHEPGVGLGRFADWLAGGAQLRTVRLHAGEPVPDAGALGDGLVVLGGTMHAYADDVAPWLPQVRALLAEDTGVPTLGICLGAQLLAAARGGRVQLAAPSGPETGPVRLWWRRAVADDPLLGPVAAAVGSPAISYGMHDDAVVDLPPDAVWLASSDQYPYQAFRSGDGWGVQFHPEVSPDVLARWSRQHDDLDPEQVRAQAGEVDGQAELLGRILAEQFVRVAAER